MAGLGKPMKEIRTARILDESLEPSTIGTQTSFVPAAANRTEQNRLLSCTDSSSFSTKLPHHSTVSEVWSWDTNIVQQMWPLPYMVNRVLSKEAIMTSLHVLNSDSTGRTRAIYPILTKRFYSEHSQIHYQYYHCANVISCTFRSHIPSWKTSFQRTTLPPDVDVWFRHFNDLHKLQSNRTN